jgi:hypothetical protein
MIVQECVQPRAILKHFVKFDCLQLILILLGQWNVDTREGEDCCLSFLITNPDFLSTKQFCFSFFVSTLFFGSKKSRLYFRSISQQSEYDNYA